MVDRDVVLAKVDTLDRCLKRIAAVTGVNRGQLTDIDVQDICVLNLQRAVQAVIDLANHMVASAGLGVPTTLKEAFALLAAEADLDAGLSQRLQAMVGFRNIAVHDYQVLNGKVVDAIVAGRLGDLRAFCAFVVGQLS